MSPSLKGQPLATKRPHVVVIPWPAQGHINPAVQFSKTLAGKGLSVTVLTFSEKKLFQTAGILSSPVAVEQISDEGILTEPIEPDYYERYRDLMCRDLPKFIAGQSHAPPCCVVYDSLFPWVLGTARELGIMAAPFFTQPAAVNAVYMNLMKGRAAAEGFPVEMEAADLPSFVTDLESYPGTLDLMTGQLANVADADWVFCNTFYSLEEKLLNRMAAHTIRINPVGPTIPTAYLGKEESSKTTTEYGLSLFNQTGSQASITQWLDSKPLGSIIYASLGSLSDIPESQIVELANALHLSNHPFIWVVRESEQDKLPPNFTSNNATCLIVDWCHQLEILAHPSVGCFVTHCGWNSTIEAISIGVPMVTLPVWVDQPTNAKFVGDLWRVGARANANITGEVVTRDEIRRGIKEVMEGESGEEIRRNVEKWKRSAHEAVADGGSSSRNIDEFVTAIKNRG